MLNDPTDVIATKTKRNFQKRMQKVAKSQTDLKWQEDYEIEDCVVSDWSDWGNCTKSCGIGEKRRYRQVIKEPKKGRSCPVLTEVRWCGSARNKCNEGSDGEVYFRW